MKKMGRNHFILLQEAYSNDKYHNKVYHSAFIEPFETTIVET